MNQQQQQQKKPQSAQNGGRGKQKAAQANQAQNQPRRNRNRNRNRNRQSNDVGRFPSNRDVGTVVKTRLTRTGISNIRSLRMSWVAGYVYVGDGTFGTADAVYFQTATLTWLILGMQARSSGQVPIAASDLDVGQIYNDDIEKHFARKVIKRMWIHVDSLQPSTSNNMMAVIGVSRGPGGMAYSVPIGSPTATVTSNTVNNVSSMTMSFPVDSWEHKTVEITDFIAGGSAARQNEFEIQSAPSSAGTDIYVTTAVPTISDGHGTVPACFAVAGNSTTVGLRGTRVHQITIEQEVDLVDFLGGMAQAAAIG